MKRYNCTLSDKLGAFGLCMEEHKEGAFVPFSEVERLQAKIFGLLDKFNSTGVAVERAISTGSVLADHPLKSRLEMLANHHEREQSMADGMVALADRCTLLAELLREANDSVYFHLESPDSRLSGEEAGKLITLTERIADTMAVKLPDHPERTLDMVPEGWQLVPVEPTTQMLAAFVEVGGKAVSGYKAMLAAATEAEPTKGRIITEGQEFELVTVLQSIVNGFSDDPAHDAAALLKRITGEVPWTGYSFQLPPRQGGEPCDSASPSSSQA